MRVGFTVTKKIGGAVVRNRHEAPLPRARPRDRAGQGLRRRRPCDDRPRQAASSAISACSARSLPARSTGCASHDRALMILIAQGWQKGPSQVLPPSCRYQPSCSAYAITAIQRYGAARGGWMALKRILPLPPVGRPGPRPRTVRGSNPRERQQEFDPRGGAERARAARLDLGGEQIFPDRQPAEHQGRERQAAAAAPAAGAAGAPTGAEGAADPLGRARLDAARPHPDAVARRARSTSRARRSTI